MRILDDSASVLTCSLSIFLLLVGTITCSAQDTRSLTWPSRLQPGDTIMFVAPAGTLDRQRMMLAKKRLEARGYRIKMRVDVFAHEGYLAGSDQRRAEELMQAFEDPEVDAVFPGTGGYGTTRILDMLDYEVIQQHPKMVIGFSDITALHAALNRHADLVTFHSPVPMWGLGSLDNLAPFSAKYFFRAVEQSADSDRDYVIEWPKDKLPPSSFGHGTARGRLTGGNLTLVAALEGTPHAIETRDAILLIEDVGEAPYRIDRMLQQLESAGKLAHLRGAVLGQFTETKRIPSVPDKVVAEATRYFWKAAALFVSVKQVNPRRQDSRYTAEGVLRQYFEPLGIPVLVNFPIGHYRLNCTLPLGGEVEIDADRQTLTVLAPEQER